MLSTGIHRDVLVRDAARSSRWLIQSRIIEHTYTASGGAREGEVGPYSVSDVHTSRRPRPSPWLAELDNGGNST